MEEKGSIKNLTIDTYSNIIERVRVLHSLIYDLRRRLEQANL